MFINPLVLLFIIIIAIILLADSSLSAALIISIMLNCLALGPDFDIMMANLGIDIQTKKPDQAAPAATVEHMITPQDWGLYGPDYTEHNAYNTSYTTAYHEPEPRVSYSGSELDYSIDAKNTIMAQKRARDKKCMDGNAVKTADYYKYHYGKELDDAENKAWWGRGEV